MGIQDIATRKDAKDGRCKGCEYCKSVVASPDWQFFGCYHQPFKGQWVVEIKDCPKDKEITTTCCECGDIMILDKKYGWTEKDKGKLNVICDSCFESQEDID